MIKPRYIKSLTFLLLCNMALGQEALSASFCWFGFWSFVNLADPLETETAKIRATRPVKSFSFLFFLLSLSNVSAGHRNGTTEHLKRTKASVNAQSA